MAHEQIDFDEQSHTYRVNGKQYPSVTQILKSVGLSADYSQVPPETLEYKRILGQELHKVIELDLQDDLENYDPILEPYVMAWRRFRDDFKIVPIQTELPVFSAQHGYCGKSDSLAQSNKAEAFFDWKSCLSVDVKYVGPQLKAYENGFREWAGLKRKPYLCYAVQLLKTGKYKVIPCDNPNDFNIFLYALQLYKWKEAC